MPRYAPTRIDVVMLRVDGGMLPHADTLLFERGGSAYRQSHRGDRDKTIEKEGSITAAGWRRMVTAIKDSGILELRSVRGVEATDLPTWTLMLRGDVTWTISCYGGGEEPSDFSTAGQRAFHALTSAVETLGSSVAWTRRLRTKVGPRTDYPADGTLVEATSFDWDRIHVEYIADHPPYTGRPTPPYPRTVSGRLESRVVTMHLLKGAPTYVQYNVDGVMVEPASIRAVESQETAHGRPALRVVR